MDEWVKQGNIRGPRGLVGPPNSLSIGVVTTVTYDQPADAEIRGVPPAQILDLTIPQGLPGEAAIFWDDVQDKPDTFPPTLPIPSSGVTGLDTKQASQDTAIINLNTALTDLGNAKADKASPTFTGDPKAPTPATGDNDTSIATTAFVKNQGYATLADPVFTGDPQAPTPDTADNDTSVATTAFVKAAITAALASLVSVSATAPAGPAVGALWYNTTTGKKTLNIWTGAAWETIDAVWA